MNATRQMARLHRRERVLRVALERRKQANLTQKEHARAGDEDGHYKSIDDHHFISHSRNTPLRIWSWLAKTHTDDLRYKVLNYTPTGTRTYFSGFRYPGFYQETS